MKGDSSSRQSFRNSRTSDEIGELEVKYVDEVEDEVEIGRAIKSDLMGASTLAGNTRSFL